PPAQQLLQPVPAGEQLRILRHLLAVPPAVTAESTGHGDSASQTNSGCASVRCASAVIAWSDGALVNRLAASSTRGSRCTSPTLLRNTPGRASTHHTARSMSSWSSSGWYQVDRVCGWPCHGRAAMDLIVWTATRR